MMYKHKRHRRYRLLSLLLSCIILNSAVLSTYAAYDLHGNNIDGSINALIQQTDQRLGSSSTTWTTAGRTVTNLPICNYY